MKNHVYQRNNAENSYEVKNYTTKVQGNIILIDDMIDSGYTFAYCGYILMKDMSIKKVFPFALADSSNRGVDNE